MANPNKRPWWWLNTSPGLTIGIGAFWILLAVVQGVLFLTGTGNGWSAALAVLWLALGVIYIVIGVAVRAILRGEAAAATAEPADGRVNPGHGT